MSSTESQIQIENNPEQPKECTYMKLNEALDDSAPCDVTLKTINGGLLHAHKCVLSKKCEYFEKMFFGGFKECEQHVVDIEELSYFVLTELINFIYTDKMPQISEETAEEILDGAELFLLNGVREKCIDFLMDSINYNNCFVIKDIAELRAIPHLTAKCNEYTQRNFNALSSYPGFLNARVENISELLQNDLIYIKKETDVFEAVMRWVRHDEINRKDCLPKLLPDVKLVFIPYDYLSELLLHEPLIRDNPECTNIVKEVCGRFSHKYGFAFMLNTTDKPRIYHQIHHKKPNRPPLPCLQCRDRNSPCCGEKSFNIVGTLNSNLTEDFQRTEWLLSMDEKNFDSEWDANWKNLNGSQF